MGNDVSTLTDRDSVLSEAEAVLSEMARMKAQIFEAKSRAVDGDYSDPDWFRRVNTALRYKGIRHQQLLRRAAELRDSANASNANSWERRFIEAARRRLKPETYQALVDEAGEEHGDGE